LIHINSEKNYKLHLKLKIREDTFEYINKHQLIEKYYNDYMNFNSNNLSFQENFNTYSHYGLKKGNYNNQVSENKGSFSYNMQHSYGKYFNIILTKR
jgi:hypothetical protein